MPITLVQPTEVRRAFAHVRQYHPTVQTVVFFPDGRWLYFDDENECPTFDERVDTAILEDAQYMVDNTHRLPVAFGYEGDG